MQFVRARRLAATLAMAGGILVLPSAAAGGTLKSTVLNAPTKTFSFIASPGSRTATIINIDGLLVNARCNPAGAPVVFAFSSASAGDILGRVFDGIGRILVIHNTQFNNRSRGILISPSSYDYDATGTVIFENIDGRVVQVTYAADNSTTLNFRRVCTVYGTLVAT